MTRRSYWCRKTIKRQPYWRPKLKQLQGGHSAVQVNAKTTILMSQYNEEAAILLSKTKKRWPYCCLKTTHWQPYWCPETIQRRPYCCPETNKRQPYIDLLSIGRQSERRAHMHYCMSVHNMHYYMSVHNM